MVARTNVRMLDACVGFEFRILGKVTVGEESSKARRRKTERWNGKTIAPPCSESQVSSIQ